MNTEQESGSRSPVQTGCMIGLGILLVCGLICGGVFGYMAYRVSENPEARKAFRAMGAGYDLFKEMHNAPGAQELRDLGCNEAVIFEKDRINEIATMMDENADTLEWDSVACIMHQDEPPAGLTCEKVAQTYGGVAKDQAQFMVSIMVQSSADGELCSGIYDSSGSLVRALSAEEQNPAASGKFQIDLEEKVESASEKVESTSEKAEPASAE